MSQEMESTIRSGDTKGKRRLREQILTMTVEEWRLRALHGKNSAQVEAHRRLYVEPLEVLRGTAASAAWVTPAVVAEFAPAFAQADAMREAFAGLERAKEEWWQAYCGGSDMEGATAWARTVREQSATLAPEARDLWDPTYTVRQVLWKIDAEYQARVGQFKAAYEKRWQALLACDAATVAQVDERLAAFWAGGFSMQSVPAKQVEEEYRPQIQVAYKAALEAKNTAAVDWYRGNFLPWTNEWDAAGVVEDDGWIPARPYSIGHPTSSQEQWLAAQIATLNSQKVPLSAQHFVSNALQQRGLAYDVAEITQKLTWTQAKVDRVWTVALAAGVDPRLMLAVIIQEGTGSWNTNGYILAGDGGHGPQPDFEDDLNHAFNGHTIQKVRTFPHYAEAFKAAVTAGGVPGDGNLFQYINYFSPMVTASGEFWAGPYATDVDWWSKNSGGGVMNYYRKLTTADGPTRLEAYLRTYALYTPANGWPAYEFRATWEGATAWDGSVPAPHAWVRAYAVS